MRPKSFSRHEYKKINNKYVNKIDYLMMLLNPVCADTVYCVWRAINALKRKSRITLMASRITMITLLAVCLFVYMLAPCGDTLGY